MHCLYYISLSFNNSVLQTTHSLSRFVGVDDKRDKKETAPCLLTDATAIEKKHKKKQKKKQKKKCNDVSAIDNDPEDLPKLSDDVKFARVRRCYLPDANHEQIATLGHRALAAIEAVGALENELMAAMDLKHRAIFAYRAAIENATDNRIPDMD
jgi:hypothetical protein